MHCENCWTGGYAQEAVKVDPVRRIFVGPCCLSRTTSVAPTPPPYNAAPEIEYGFEFSSRNGVQAFVQYGGLSVQYHKPPEVIERWFQEFQAT